MDSQLYYSWQSDYLSAILEFDPAKISRRLDQATRVIEDRLKMPLEPGGLEHQAILDARSGIAMLRAVATDARPV